MSIEIKIIIPSMSRFDGMTTHKHVINSIVCVPKSQLEAYTEHYPDCEYVAHPDSVKGLAMKRQWIWEHFKNVFMLDDDLIGFHRMTTMSGESVKVPATDAYHIIQQAGNIAQLCGCVFFGFNNYVVPEHYSGHRPFSLSGYINGCGTGLLEGGLGVMSYVDFIKSNEDYWISGVNAFYFRKCFIDERYCLAQAGFANNTGGLSAIRTNVVEKEDYEILRHYFGEAIQLKKEGTGFKKRHAYSKILKVPY